ncbi:MAG: 16S rRNA (adenine(1518)-N(6)/adenine(1519)-N(6))-dimethyltransferase RsmA [Thermodesulfobacteriota bacterium]
MSSQTFTLAQASRAGAMPQAKRSLGQNFLVDPNTIRAVVDCLAATPGEPVFEIGPGRGALTAELLRRGLELTVLEKDMDLARHVATHFSGARVIVGDALHFAWEALPPGSRLVGNLPYNVASPIIWEIVSRLPGATRLVFTVQKEVGQRLCAQPGNRAYGGLSVWVQTFAAVRYERTLSSTVFRPRPKVDSAVVRMEPHAHPPGVAAQRQLARTLRLCFQKRRKQLGTILKNVWGPELADWLDTWGLDRTVRPEALSPEAFLELSRLVSGVDGQDEGKRRA